MRKVSKKGKTTAGRVEGKVRWSLGERERERGEDGVEGAGIHS